ncbi:MAG: helix-turn-helix domain-containing protein [Actinobacteria bacterium]|nr:helix-turn-helix domain-containing protein [Actinomycetota bacterium]
MEGRIGNELRREREARGIGLDEVEAATGVRARFLAAIEEEEWERLPGEFYARAFTRTYATYLGLDPAEFALGPRPDRVGEPAGPRVEPRLVPEEAAARPRPWLQAAAVVAGVALLAVIAIVAAALSGGGATRPASSGSAGEGHHRGGGAPNHAAEQPPPPPPGVSLRLTATAEVWVCLLDAAGKPLIDGQILAAGSEAGPFHSRRYSMSFGNGGVELKVDGSRATMPETGSPIGLAIAADGSVSEIPEGERPECA